MLPLLTDTDHDRNRRKIAVIGTGIAGMASAWLLDQRHDVILYEKNSRIGGHTNTVNVPSERGDIPIDTGFIVFNDRNYPNLTALFRHLGVEVKDSEMSFAASLRDGQFEYAGTDLNGLLGQRLNALNPKFWKMVADILRFNREAPAFLQRDATNEISLGEYLRSQKFGTGFIEDHILPMGAAIWSTTAAEMEAYPAAAFIRFFESHGLLTINDRPQWQTVDGGSRQYVRLLTAPYRDRIRYDGIKSVRRLPHGVRIETESGASEIFDAVVIATHANEALEILADPDPLETGILGPWSYTRNRAVLHSDDSLMPRRRRVWSSWNFIDSSGSEGNRLCVTYWMNRLQGIPGDRQYFVTLNPVREPDSGSVIYETEYTHPFFDKAALQSQNRLWSLQGRRRTWFCGSYFGHGFHEDALQAGLAVAEQLGGVRRPWSVEGENGRLRLDPVNVQAAA
jgi:predicted NAD/FAD-binding protein